jgi:LacI family transcriptional regulator
VSRALSGRGPVGTETRRRVEAAAHRLHYQPSAAARSLRTERTLIVGVLVPDLGNPVFVPFLRAVQRVAQASDYAVMVVDAQRSPAVERRALDRLTAQGVDALILAGPARDDANLDGLRRAGCLVMDDTDTGASPRRALALAERPASRAVCDALAALGHRRIGFVSRRAATGESGRRRWQALRAGAAPQGMALERLVLSDGDDPEGTGAALDAVVRRADPVTALVCAAHDLAPVVLRGLGSAGIEVPDECSVVTYGDSDWAAAFRPALSVVTLDLDEAGLAVTDVVVRRLAGERSAAAPLAPARFVRRASIGPAPGSVASATRRER